MKLFTRKICNRKAAKILFFMLIVSVCCFFAACAAPPLEQLSSPSNLHMQEKILVWDEVENATSYIVYFNHKEHETVRNYYDLSSLTEPDTYKIEVLAVGDGENFADSNWVRFYYNAIIPTENLAYTLLEDGSGYEVSKGTADLTGTIVIPDYHEGLPVKSIAMFSTPGLPSYVPNRVTTGVRFPETLEKIWDFAFDSFEQITELNFPKSIKSIGLSFRGCTRLKKVTLPEGLTQIGTYAFLSCSNLSEIKFPNSLQSVGMKVLEGTAWMEAQPKGFVVNGNVLLTYKGDISGSLTIPSSVKLIASYAFDSTETEYEMNMESVFIPSGVALGYGVFANCHLLKSFTLPPEMKAIPGYTFQGCTGLKSLSLSAGLQEIGDNAFSGCTGLNSISLPEGLPEIGSGAFSGCTGLNSISLPESLQKIGVGAFADCTGFNSISLPEGLQEIGGGAFRGCTALTGIEFPSTLKTVGVNAFKGSGLVSVTIPEYITLGNGVFAECKNLSEVIIQGTREIPPMTFENCTALTSVWFLEGTETIASAFSGCTALKNVRLPDSVKTISNIFSGCTALESIRLPAYLETVDVGAFSGCTALKQIDLPASVKTIASNAFKNSGITSINLPASLTTLGANAFENSALTSITLNEGCETIEDYTFAGCTALTEVICSSSLESIGKYAFQGCTALTKIKWTTSLQTIGDYAFQGCGFEELTLPEYLPLGDTYNLFRECLSLKTVVFLGTKIPPSAFNGCTALESVILPEGLIEIALNAFMNCSSLTEIELPSSLEILSAAFTRTNLKFIELPENIKDIVNPFSFCENLKEIVVPSTLTSKVSSIVSTAKWLERIYFKGTQAEWEENIPDNFQLAETVTLCFYVENEAEVPLDGGSYWHYVGEKVELWFENKEQK